MPVAHPMPQLGDIGLATNIASRFARVAPVLRAPSRAASITHSRSTFGVLSTSDTSSTTAAALGGVQPEVDRKRGAVTGLSPKMAVRVLARGSTLLHRSLVRLQVTHLGEKRCTLNKWSYSSRASAS